LTVTFTDQSVIGSAPIVSWQWDFGDGTPASSETNPTHVYTGPGSFTVALTVGTGLENVSETKPDYITVLAPPAAAFTADATAGNAPLTIQFTDQSTPGSAPITAWQWDFGDGTAASAEQNPKHTYANPGTFTVTLSVTTSVAANTATKPDYIVLQGAPVASFTAAPASGNAPLTVHFTDTSAAGTSPITLRQWDFGDGSAPSGATNPAHTYTKPGSYTVTLTVMTAVGSDLKTATITVSPHAGEGEGEGEGQTSGEGEGEGQPVSCFGGAAGAKPRGPGGDALLLVSVMGLSLFARARRAPGTV
jgi:PKD repeat protein